MSGSPDSGIRPRQYRRTCRRSRAENFAPCQWVLIMVRFALPVRSRSAGRSRTLSIDRLRPSRLTWLDERHSFHSTTSSSLFRTSGSAVMRPGDFAIVGACESDDTASRASPPADWVRAGAVAKDPWARLRLCETLRPSWCSSNGSSGPRLKPRLPDVVGPDMCRLYWIDSHPLFVAARLIGSDGSLGRS